MFHFINAGTRKCFNKDFFVLETVLHTSGVQMFNHRVSENGNFRLVS